MATTACRARPAGTYGVPWAGWHHDTPRHWDWPYEDLRRLAAGAGPRACHAGNDLCDAEGCGVRAPCILPPAVDAMADGRWHASRFREATREVPVLEARPRV